MTQKPSYGVGANAELDAALNRAASLDYGEALFIPVESKGDAEKIRRYFFRQRKRAQAEALSSGATLDPAEADPWRGLVTGVADTVNGWILILRRPKKLTHIFIVKPDGSTATEEL